MGCIEIRVRTGVHRRAESLIETWDVLKYLEEYDIQCIRKGLIETWDVLKCVSELARLCGTSPV